MKGTSKSNVTQTRTSSTRWFFDVLSQSNFTVTDAGRPSDSGQLSTNFGSLIENLGEGRSIIQYLGHCTSLKDLLSQ